MSKRKRNPNRASKDAIENFCALNDLTQTIVKDTNRRNRKYQVLRRDLTPYFKISANKPISAWISALAREKATDAAMHHGFMQYSNTRTGRWGSGLMQNLRQLARVHRAGDATQVWFDEYSKLDAQVVASMNERKIPDASGSGGHGAADGHGVLRVRPEQLGPDRLYDGETVQRQDGHAGDGTDVETSTHGGPAPEDANTEVTQLPRAIQNLLALNGLSARRDDILPARCWHITLEKPGKKARRLIIVSSAQAMADWQVTIDRAHAWLAESQRNGWDLS